MSGGEGENGGEKDRKGERKINRQRDKKNIENVKELMKK